MIEFVKKYQKQISMTMAISVLVLCYYQRQEINSLRQQLGNKSLKDSTMMNIDKEAAKALDSLKYDNSNR
jgi:hypothetical protein